MSWQEKLQVGLQITTGDGEIYTPLSLVSSYTANYEFNVSEFEFPEIEGTKVDKRLAKGTRYSMEFMFQGDDCIEMGLKFDRSAKDKRPWTVLHPVFGQFIGHPISMELDSTAINIFKIKCEVVETILDNGTKAVFDPINNSKVVTNKAMELNVSSFENSITEFTPDDVNKMNANTKKIFDIASASIKDTDVYNQYFNLFSTATNKINNALSDVNFGIQFVQQFINYPSQFQLDIKNRINLLKQQAILFSENLDALNMSFNEKKIVENNFGSVVETTIQAISTPQENDYESAKDVYYIIEESLNIWNSFISTIQEMQSSNGYEVGAYIPNADFIESISYAFNYAISNLFVIGMSAQQERIVYLMSDSTVINETHKYYGLDQFDVNLMRFVKTNNISLNESIILEKGRKLVHYV